MTFSLADAPAQADGSSDKPAGALAREKLFADKPAEDYRKCTTK